jgi:hypothetical protein
MTTAVPLTTHIPVRNRERVVVSYATVDNDPALLAKLHSHRWSDVKGHAKTSVRRPTDNRVTTVLLHQLVWQHFHGRLPAPPLQLDHKDRDKANNVIANLRVADRSTQRANTNISRANRSGYRGVSRCGHMRNGRTFRYWVARVKLRGRCVLQQYFSDTPQGLLDAARAVNDAYRIHYPHVDVPNPHAEGASPPPLNAAKREGEPVNDPGSK